MEVANLEAIWSLEASSGQVEAIWEAKTSANKPTHRQMTQPILAPSVKEPEFGMLPSATSVLCFIFHGKVSFWVEFNIILWVAEERDLQNLGR